MDLEHMVGMQPALYHRYNVDENEEEDEDEVGKPPGARTCLGCCWRWGRGWAEASRASAATRGLKP